jgi:transcriptional regulator GlxA family with amidase domain
VPVVAAVLTSRRAVGALRRGLARGGPSVVACQSWPALDRVLRTRLLDAWVFAPHRAPWEEVERIRAGYPGLPALAYGAFRPDDGDLLLACRAAGVAGVAVEPVDDPVVGELLRRHSLSEARRRLLADAPRVLRLLEPLQERVWRLVLAQVDRPVRTGEIARALRISREHLSRQFGAGGAPNLKRVIDLTRIVCAAQLLGNPGYDVGAVVRLLHFASPSHLSRTARRIANAGPAELGGLGPRGVLAAFVRGNTRSRAG